MPFSSLFQPEDLQPQDLLQRGLRALTFRTLAASAIDGLVSGGFLAAYALALGASNFHIGILIAIPFIMQPIQIAAVIAIERIRMRKAVTIPASVAVDLSWLLIGLIPFAIISPSPVAVTLLLLLTAIRGAGNAIEITGWTSWLRDLAPPGAIGGFFAQRLRTATASAALSGLAAALFIDWWAANTSPQNLIFGYAYAILFGSIVFGFCSDAVTTLIPEPRMAKPEGARPSVLQMLAGPLQDDNFRRLLTFLFIWNFVAQLAVPFFAVYMLIRLELPLALVVGLGVLSQLSSVLFLRVWGPFTDRFGCKVILSICASLYLLAILGWTFVMNPDRHPLTLPLLFFLHFLIGVAAAGIEVASTAIRMKMAPQARATAFLTASSLAINLGAGISPLIGGALVDFLNARQLEIIFRWIDPARIVSFPAVFLTGYDFLFTIAFVLGLLTLGALGRIQEEGEANNEVVMNELMTQTRENLRALSFVPGLSSISQFPLAGLRYLPAIPGLNVAAGVTAYQIASSIRYTVDGLALGSATARQVSMQIGQAVARASHGSRDITRHGVEIAFGATEGAIRSIASRGSHGSRFVGAAVSGTLTAMRNAGARPPDAVKGVVYGALHGANEGDMELEDVVASSLDAVRESADQLGLSEHEAVMHAVEAAFEVAEGLAEEPQSQVREALLDELMEEMTGQMQGSTDDEANAQENAPPETPAP